VHLIRPAVRCVWQVCGISTDRSVVPLQEQNFKEIFISWQVCENWKLSPVLLVHADNKCFFYRRKSHAINIPEERQYTWWFESEAGNESGLGWKM
jgi:hypothetical protein